MSDVHERRKSILARGFELYQNRKAMVLHLSDNNPYNWHTYHGKVRGSFDEFSNSPAKHRYCAVARKVGERPSTIHYPFCLFLIHQKHGYISEKMITPKKFEQVVKDFSAETLAWSTDTLPEEVKMIKEAGFEHTHDALKAEDGEIPFLIEKFMAGDISWRFFMRFNWSALKRIVMANNTEQNDNPVVQMTLDKLKPYYDFIPHNLRHDMEIFVKQEWRLQGAD